MDKGTGFLLLYKRLEVGRLLWSHNTQEAAELTEEQLENVRKEMGPSDKGDKE